MAEGKYAHLDPDFEYLTYGEEGNKAKRLRNLKNLGEGDLLVFYSGLRPVYDGKFDNRPGHLCYAIIGFYEIDHMEYATTITPERWKVNAHSRREPQDDDIVFFGKKGKSGRLSRCIDIGEYHSDEGTYWTKKEFCSEWGELKRIKDGCIGIFITRSGALPTLKNPGRFYEWLRREMKNKEIELIEKNNPD